MPRGQGQKTGGFPVLPLAPPPEPLHILWMSDRAQRLTWCFTINNYVDEDGEEETFPDLLCSYLIEAHEMSETGTPHIQGFAYLKTKMRLSELKKICPKAHFEGAKGTPYQNYLYCAKGEQTHAEWLELRNEGPNWGKNACFLEWGERPKAPINAHKKKPADTTYSDALAAPTIREGMEIVKKRKARDYCLHGESIERNMKRAKTLQTVSKFLITDFNREPIPFTKLTSVFVTGRSGTGKTQWALAHFKNPLLVRHIDALKTLTPDHDGVVFDDMCFDHWPIESVIHLLDFELASDIHVRYGTVHVPPYTRKIFTSNKKNIFYTYPVDAEQQNAVERRYMRVDVSTPLFGIDTVFGAAATNAYNVMVGSHNTDLRHRYAMPERWPAQPDMMDDDDPTPVDDYSIDLNQVD